ncbi:SKP1-like protein 21 [Olea europaea var. sylvestris]|uniref:SKP1-like protein 21 n=1 Tax=Olea europaea var. sylvestris TaxID=158386 RepID=UPI000C1D2544|nr:SKP1-like protein 21 [Olea europaea var. sylvestris]XP_022851958.1 SKP1-like protein 21 [Olea europaea var. sylvestris]
MIEGKTPEEICETSHIPDDLIEVEKLETLRNITDDPRIRLLNRLYARKRKELKERQNLKNIEVEEEQCVDERSADDHLSFVNAGIGGIANWQSILFNEDFLLECHIIDIFYSSMMFKSP